MINLQKQLENFMKDMPYDNVNNVIGVYFKNKADFEYAINSLEDFFKENDFSRVRTMMNYFTICKKCKINFIVVRDYLLGYEFPYVIYDENIGVAFVKHIIQPSFTGIKDENYVKLDLLGESK